MSEEEGIPAAPAAPEQQPAPVKPVKPTEPPQNPQEPTIQPQSATLIDQANEAAKRLEDSNKELKTLLDRQDSNKAKEILGGKADAGKPAEETPAQYKERVMRGEI